MQRTLERNERVRGSPARLGRALPEDFSDMVTCLQLPTMNEMRSRVRRPMGSMRKPFSTIIAGGVWTMMADGIGERAGAAARKHYGQR